MPAEHPTPQDVAGLLSNTLPVDEAAGIYQHFDTCESCRTKFPQVVAASESADPDSDSEVRYQQFRQQLLVAGPSPRQDPSAARPSPAPSIPGYDFVRVIGRGGMGVVYEAIETATGRRVAVKVVSGSSPALSTLFQQEVRTHARMQHPNLVRFLSAGEADGRPYLVMEYVDGGTLAERVKESPLSPRLAVRLTEVIARAVGDAHRLGFVHRDLKPANVLLDHGDRESGVLWDDKPKEQEQEHEKPKEKSKVKKKEYVQVKASDFGLAHELSDTGSGGTPAYMSPEQTNGNKTTPATDVWALGVMLYELLTGGRPFSGTKEELFTGIQKGKYPPPKHRGKKLSADLTAVIAKCLLLNPQDRYANARELADELRRLLDTRPVLARPVGRFRRAALWGKRNPIGALLAGVVAVAFIGSLAFSYYLSEARDQAKTAAGVAQSEKTIADQQRDRANRRFNQVRELANKFISFDDPLRALAGSTPARKLLVQDALTYLKDLGTEAGDSPDLLHEIAVAYMRVGDTQGNPGTANLGETAAALESYRNALRTAEQLAKIDPTDRRGLRDQMIAHGKIGDMQRVTGKMSAALTSYETAKDFLDRLERAGEDRRLLDHDQVVSHQNLGHVQEALGSTTDALANHQEGLAILLWLLERNPKDARTKRSLAVGHSQIGHVQEVMGQSGEALKSYEQELVILEALAEERDGDAELLRDLVVAYNHVGRMLAATGQTRKANELFGKGQKIADALAVVDPRNALAKRDRAIASERQGEGYEAVGRARQALASHRQSLEFSQGLATADPDNRAAQRGLATAHEKVGDLEVLTGDTKAAQTSYQRAFDIRATLAAGDGADTAVQREMSVSHNKLAGVYESRGRLTEALTSFQDGLKIRRRLAEADLSSATARRDVAFNLDRIGHLHQVLGQDEPAADHYQEAFDIYAALAAADSSDAGRQEDLATAHEHLGAFRHRLRKLKDALASYTACHEIRKGLVDRDPENVLRGRGLAITCEKLGDVSRDLDNSADAQKWYQDCFDRRVKLATRDPDSALAKRDLATSYERRGLLRERAGDRGQAKRDYDECLTLWQAVLKDDPANADVKRSVAIAHERLGDVHLSSDVKAAEKHFVECRKLREELLKIDPQSVVAREQLVTALTRLGDLNLRLRRPKLAGELYRECLTHAEKLVADAPKSVSARRTLSIAYEKLGDLSVEAGDFLAARRYRLSDLKLARAIRAEADTPQAKHDLALSCQNAGCACLYAGDPHEALGYCREGLQLAEELATAVPDEVPYRTNLAFALLSMGMVSTELNDYSAAEKYCRRGIGVLDQLDRDGRFKGNADAERFRQALRHLAQVCGNALRAIDDLKFAEEGERKGLLGLLTIRARVMASRGEHAKAAEAIEKRLAMAPDKADTLYEVALAHAQCANAVIAGTPPDKLPADRADAAGEYHTAAMKSLTRAVELGFKDLTRLEADRNLTRIRQEPEYRDIVARLKQKQ